MDLNGVPQEAFEQLKNSTSPEEVLELARQYGVELTREHAEAAVGKDKEDLPCSSGGCSEEIPNNCLNCLHGRIYGKDPSGNVVCTCGLAPSWRGYKTDCDDFVPNAFDPTIRPEK